MLDRYQVLLDAQANWDADRPVMREHNTDLLELWMLLNGEVLEAGDEVQEYLLLQESGHMPNEMIDALAKELDDIFLFLLQMYSMIGVDLYQSVMDKRAYNLTRYTAQAFSGDKSYSQARDESRAWVAATNWKDEFYHPDYTPNYNPNRED